MNWKGVRQWQERWSVMYQGWLLQSLKRATFWGDKFKQRFTVLGFALVSAIVVTLVFGANTRKTMIYQLFTLFVAMFLVALVFVWIKSYRKQAAFSLTRSLPSFATVGIPFSYHVQVRNELTSDVYGVRLAERGRRLQPSLNQFLNMREPNEEKRNIYDRKMGFYRYTWLQNWLRGGAFYSTVIAEVKANKSCDTIVKFTPIRRGYVHFSGMRLSVPEPLGLMYNFQDIEQSASLLVLPTRYDIPSHLTQAGKSITQYHGLALASDVGQPEEFHHMREYNVGDSPRHIHWPSLAKVGKPLVKVFQDENFTRQALLLDNFGEQTGATQQVFEEAVSVAAGFATGIDASEMLLDLMFVGDQHHAEDMTGGRSLAHAEQMLESLASVGLCSDAYFKNLSEVMLGQADHFGSCVMVLIQWDKQRQDLVQQLLGLSISVRVFLVQEQDTPSINTNLEHLHVLKVGQIQQDLDSIDEG
ncbi:MAG: DUF58 domain-containing protein [Ghiorsea sp.]